MSLSELNLEYVDIHNQLLVIKNTINDITLEDKILIDKREELLNSIDTLVIRLEVSMKSEPVNTNYSNPILTRMIKDKNLNGIIFSFDAVRKLNREFLESLVKCNVSNFGPSN